MKLAAADRKILLVAGLVLLVTVLILGVVSPNQDQSSPYPSPYSTASDGAKAAYTLLSQLGYHVEHWRRSPATLLEKGTNTVLVVVVPTQNPTDEDRQKIRQYVQRGGRLLAIGSSAFALLPHSDPLPGIPHYAWQSYRALIPSAFTRSAPEIEMAPSSFYWNRSDSDAQIQYGESEYGVVASYRYGNGVVLWWATPDPLTNSGISQKSNLQLLLNSLGSSENRVVLWDDYFHEGEVTLAESLLNSPLKWSLLQ